MVLRRSIHDIMYNEQETDILFIQPPLLQRIFHEEQDRVHLEFWDTINKYAALLGDLPFEPNHGLYQLAAILQQTGLKVDVLDFHVLDKVLRQKHQMIQETDIEEVLNHKTAKVFGISVKTVAANWAMRISNIIKRLYPDSIVLLGGVHATFQAQELLEACEAIDIVLKGEADETILDLWQQLENEKKLDKVPGIVFRRDDGVIIENPRENTSIDLDKLPFPAYELVCREATPLVPRILSARGCVLKCGYCVVTAFHNYKINFRSPQRVVDEIEYMQKQFGVDFVCIGDLTFMAYPKRGHEICHEIIRRKLDIKWWCQSTVGRIDADTASLMKQAGCVQIGFGIESGSQHQIDRSSKRIDLTLAKNQCQLVKDAGISVQTYWILGLPEETFESAMETIELLRQFIQDELTDVVHISVAVPYPGTPFFEEPEQFGYRIVDRNFDNFWMNCDELGAGKPVIETKSLSRDHIYMFWQLALATATAEFKKRYSGRPDKVHFYPQDFGETRLT